MKNKRIIGITGPTGAGKSILSEALRQAGVPVLDADAAAREVTVPGHPCLAELADAFTDKILLPDGSLDRKALAKAAFSSEEGTVKLNSITHPHILALLQKRIAEALSRGDAVAVDAPLLFESGLDALCTETVAVLAPPSRRRRRIMRRDGLTAEEAEARMAAQPGEDFYLDRADGILYNRGTLKSFRAAAAAWAERIK